LCLFEPLPERCLDLLEFGFCSRDEVGRLRLVRLQGVLPPLQALGMSQPVPGTPLWFLGVTPGSELSLPGGHLSRHGVQTVLELLQEVEAVGSGRVRHDDSSG
jgi:hypothetical protein